MTIPKTDEQSKLVKNEGYRFGFNGKENDIELTWQDYGMREYDPRIGRFISVDPLSKKFPELTTYQFASNRPIDGIDLDGKEYLKADEARLEFKHGRLQLKVENLLTINKNAWKRADSDPSNWKSGQLGLDPTIANIYFNSPSDPQPKDIPGEHLPEYSTGHTASGVKTHVTNRTGRSLPEGGGLHVPPGKGWVGKGSAIADFVGFALEQYMSFAAFYDMNKVEEHQLIASQVANDVERALKSGQIPPQYQTKEALVNIMNVVLQGESNSADKKIYEIGMKIYNQKFSNPDKQSNVKIKKETAPADATSVKTKVKS